jgi:hypothetical protein
MRQRKTSSKPSWHFGIQYTEGSKMRYNYYCNGQGFEDYDDAVFYHEVLLAQFRIYKAIFTRMEVESMIKEIA